MRDTQTKEIGGVKVKVTQHPALASLRLSAQLADLVKGALDGASFDNETDAALAFAGIGSAIMKLNEAEFTTFVRRLFEHTHLSYHSEAAGKNIHTSADTMALDDAFAGKLDGLLEAIVFVIKVNFERAFKDGMSKFAALMPEPEAAESESA